MYDKESLEQEAPKKTTNSPFSSFIDFICERYAKLPHEVLEQYTYRQMKFIVEGAEWNINEQSEDGQKKNRRKSTS
jgi:hypothetical protein